MIIYRNCIRALVCAVMSVVLSSVVCIAAPVGKRSISPPSFEARPDLYMLVAHEFEGDEYPVGELVLLDVGDYRFETNVYGVTSHGINSGRAGFHVPGGPLLGGTVYELTADLGHRYRWSHKILYSFCAAGGDACSDGESPRAGLLQDSAGNLFGTTIGGGANGRPQHKGRGIRGTVFKLAPNLNRTAWTYSVLYSFCSQGGDDCTDGRSPMAALIQDASGNLYGTTSGGGKHGGGTAFKLSPNVVTSKWTHSVLYSFCAQTSCTDGSAPMAGLAQDAAGNLYGTTAAGGRAGGGGTVFKLSPDAVRNSWSHSVLYSFCRSCDRGSDPRAQLAIGPDGTLYGSTIGGGIDVNTHWLWGIDPSTVQLHGTLGLRSVAALFSDPWGGTLFKLSPDPDGKGWTHAVLYRFCTLIYCVDGKRPVGRLAIATQGATTGVIGMTFEGGGMPIRSYPAGKRINRGVLFGASTVHYGLWTSLCQNAFDAFTPVNRLQCPQGGSPQGGVVIDGEGGDGDLYGTASYGGNGSDKSGVVFVMCRTGGFEICREWDDHGGVSP